MTRPASKILIVDDDEFVLLSLRLLLEQHNFSVIPLSTPERIQAILEQEEIQCVLLDMNFRPGDTSSTQGLFWLSQIRKADVNIPVIMLTAYGEIALAVEAMKQGAFDFVPKPWQNEKLLVTIRNSQLLYQERVKVKQLTDKQKILSDQSQKPSGLIGASRTMQEIKQLISKIAATDTSVLIQGANGTGKEVIAHEIHNQSLRATEVFINVDVGSLSETLFESELFGHKKGAFTDAREDRVGRIEAASGGTLFLDEIGNLPLKLQAKLLTVLQSKTITRIGTNHPVQVDVRVISATNCNLKQMVEEKTFREDLYYRLNTVVISIPTLFDRLEDLPTLANHFLTGFKTKYHKEDRVIPASVMEALQKYRWPGNVRELQHAVERAVILSETKELTLDDFGVMRNELSGELIFDHLNLEKLEAWAIRRVLEKHQGNVSHAAQELGLSRGAMYRRMEKYGI